MENEIKIDSEELNLIDDIYFQAVMEDKDACSEALSIILGDPGLQVKKVETQKRIAQMRGRSVVIDAYCLGSDNRSFIVEMQQSDTDDLFKRMRYEESGVTIFLTKKGSKFSEVPDVVSIAITCFDPFRMGRTIYVCHTFIEGTNVAVPDGTTKIYVNTKVREESKISDLMQFFKETKSNERFPRLTARYNYLKSTDKGKRIMSELMQKFYDEAAAQGRKEGLALGEKKGLALGKKEGLALGEKKGLALGKKEGLALGKKEGLALGEKKGIAQGKKEGFGAVILHIMSAMQMSYHEAVEYLKLTPEQSAQYAKFC